MLNYITGIPVLYTILKKNHNTETNFHTSIVHNTSIPVLRSPSTGDPFGVICTFQSSQLFERLSMRFGVVDHIRSSALTTADRRPPSWNRITDSTHAPPVGNGIGEPHFIILYSTMIISLYLYSLESIFPNNYC